MKNYKGEDMDNVWTVDFCRNGTIREWKDSKNKRHVEEVLDVFVENIKLPRGMCGCMFKKAFKRLPAQGEKTTFELKLTG
jgi:hypothetical protein